MLPSPQKRIASHDDALQLFVDGHLRGHDGKRTAAATSRYELMECPTSVGRTDQGTARKNLRQNLSPRSGIGLYL